MEEHEEEATRFKILILDPLALGPIPEAPGLIYSPSAKRTPSSGTNQEFSPREVVTVEEMGSFQGAFLRR